MDQTIGSWNSRRGRGPQFGLVGLEGGRVGGLAGGRAGSSGTSQDRVGWATCLMCSSFTKLDHWPSSGGAPRGPSVKRRPPDRSSSPESMATSSLQSVAAQTKNSSARPPASSSAPSAADSQCGAPAGCPEAAAGATSSAGSLSARSRLTRLRRRAGDKEALGVRSSGPFVAGRSARSETVSRSFSA